MQLYDENKIKLGLKKEYKDLQIESVLSTGDKTLSFLYPKNLAKDFKNEGYIRTKIDEYVIKSVSSQVDYKVIKATLNVEDLEGKVWESFSSLETTINNCLSLACAGTGWTVEVTGVTKKRTIRMTNCSSWDIIQEARKTYLVEIKFDTINKKIIVKETLGADKGTYFTESLNLKRLDIENDSFDFYTRLIPIGKDGLKISLNGKDYLENYQYSTKVKTLIWKDERYTDVNSLIEDGTAKLNELSKPRIAYSIEVIDLAKAKEDYKNILSYEVGDTIYLISKENDVKIKQRIVKTIEYPDSPEKNSCEIANTIFSFEDMQKEYKDAVDTVDNITSDNGTISERAIAEPVRILTVNKVEANVFNALEGRVGTLEVNKLNVDVANIQFANINNALIDKADITDLTATNIKFDVAEGGALSLQTLLSNFISGESGQFLNLTGDNVTIANGIIKDAMIDTVNASKINAGVINSNLVTIQGANGNLSIKDNTIQIKDSNRVRVQIGKDASNDYNMYVWDSTGKLMFDATGLKADGIKSKIIRDDMVSDTANIQGSKLNISSVISAINNDNTTTLKSSKVLLDTEGQSLEVAFNSLKTNVDGFDDRIESNTTQLDIQQGNINTLISDNSIIKDDITTINNNYSNINQTVNSINQSVAAHETSINNTNTKLASVEINLSSITNKVSTAEASLSGLATRISSAETKLTADSLTTTISSALSGSNSITTTKFTMDKNGLTIKNGGLKIQNNAGTNVLSADSNGNLTVTASITSSVITGGTINGTTITGGTISGSTLTGVDINSKTFNAQQEIKLNAGAYSPQIVFNNYPEGVNNASLTAMGHIFVNSSGDMTLQTYNRNRGVYIDGNLYIGGSNVIASGSNTNGRYVRFFDGTQICYMVHSNYSADCSSTWQKLFYHNGAFTFPAAFTEVPAISSMFNTTHIVWTGGSNTLSTTACPIRFYCLESGTYVGRLTIVAIGRWK